jgi:hypothetical protein
MACHVARQDDEYLIRVFCEEIVGLMLALGQVQ